MSGPVFYLKWRPQTLAQVVSQHHITETLLNALKSGHISHAYLFCGPRGTGKTSTARILAKAVNCLTNKGKGEPCNKCHMCQAITEGSALDIIEIDAASRTSVEDVRDLRDKINYAPGEANYKVYIIDEVHMLSTSASNALLKTIEEPPPRVIFVLATTEIHKVLPTVISRCQRYDFRRVSQADVINKLADICSSEGLRIAPEALKLIARKATGSLRDAENLLEQISTYYGSEVSLEQAKDALGIIGDKRSQELASAILSGDTNTGIKLVNSVSDDGIDLRQFSRELIEHLRHLLLVKTGSDDALDLSSEELATIKQTASYASLEQALKAIKSLSRLDFSSSDNPTLGLELAIFDLSLAETKKSEQKEAVASTIPVKDKPFVKETRTALSKVEKKAKEVKQKQEKPVVNKENPPAEPAVNPVKEDEKLNHLINNWGDIIEQAPASTRKTAALAILRSAGVRPVAFENNTVTLSFKYSYHKDKIDEPENKKVAAEIIGCSLGSKCQVICVYEQENNHLIKEAQKMGARIIDMEE